MKIHNSPISTEKTTIKDLTMSRIFKWMFSPIIRERHSHSIRKSVLKGRKNTLDMRKQYLILLPRFKGLANKYPQFQTHYNLISTLFFESELYLDLCTSILALTSSWRDEHIRHLLARVIALNLYEGSSKLKVLLDKHIKTFITQRLDNQDVFDMSTKCRRSVKSFLNSNENYLLNVRVNCFAHRDPTCAKYLEAHESVNPVRIMNILSDFLKIQKEFRDIAHFCIKKGHEDYNKFSAKYPEGIVIPNLGI